MTIRDSINEKRFELFEKYRVAKTEIEKRNIFTEIRLLNKK